MRRSSRSSGCQRGALVVEAALFTPVIILLVGGLVGMSIRLSNYMYLNQIARELVLKVGATPYMAEVSRLNLSPTELTKHTFFVGPNEPIPPVSDSRAATCADLLYSDTTYDPDFINGDPSCPLDLLQYYAVTLVKSKNILVSGDIKMEFSFGADPSNTTSGLCFINVTLSAPQSGWLMLASGSVKVTSRGPYVSLPVPSAASGCRLGP